MWSVFLVPYVPVWVFWKLLYLLGFSHTTICSVYRERSENEKMCSELQFPGWKCLVDIRGQRMDRLLWADRKATVTLVTWQRHPEVRPWSSLSQDGVLWRWGPECRHTEEDCGEEKASRLLTADGSRTQNVKRNTPQRLQTVNLLRPKAIGNTLGPGIWEGNAWEMLPCPTSFYLCCNIWIVEGSIQLHISC